MIVTIFMKIGLQLTEKSAKNMLSWLITFNVTLGIDMNINIFRYSEPQIFRINPLAPQPPCTQLPFSH